MERCDAQSKLFWLQILKLGRTATLREVKAAYKRSALSLHPDKQRGATADQAAAVASQFQQVAEAYDVLTHESVRAAYDKVRDYMVRLALMIRVLSGILALSDVCAIPVCLGCQSSLGLLKLPSTLHHIPCNLQHLQTDHHGLVGTQWFHSRVTACASSGSMSATVVCPLQAACSANNGAQSLTNRHSCGNCEE